MAGFDSGLNKVAHREKLAHDQALSSRAAQTARDLAVELSPPLATLARRA
jgi:hypothetical protein